MNSALRWGLPEGFVPVRYPIDDETKEMMRGVLQEGEPVVATIANEGGTVIVIATPQRLFTIKAKTIGGAGVTGFNTKEFPWEAITNLVLQNAPLNVVFQIHYRSNDGIKIEVGRRAKLAKDMTDKVMPFETEAGKEFFQAIYGIWHHKMLEQQKIMMQN